MKRWDLALTVSAALFAGMNAVVLIGGASYCPTLNWVAFATSVLVATILRVVAV